MVEIPGAGTSTFVNAAMGTLLARPQEPVQTGRTGIQSLELTTNRDALLYVPPSVRADRPAPLIVLLHGAGGSARNILGLLKEEADRTGTILLVPQSRGQSWDAIVDGLGPDVALLDRALERVFGRYSVDAERVAIAGFSDGGSYALTLGLANGELFSHVIAFSPGFSTPPRLEGQPLVFVSHGKQDVVLPIELTSRRVVPRLIGLGYAVDYRELDAAHGVPAETARAAMQWFLER